MAYHHGNLREALLEAAYQLARGDGADAVTVRAAARAVGVSAPAAYRHFEDRDALVAQVAQRCRVDLAHQIAAARDRHRSPRRRFRATGRAYILFALEEPGLIDCAFAPRPLFAGAAEITDPSAATDPMCERDTAAEIDPDGDALAVLVGVLDELVEAGQILADRRVGAELVAWTAVHGLAMLLAGTEPEDAGPAIDRVLKGIEDSLLT
jgi:AcrR family transcriptional regulator